MSPKERRGWFKSLKRTEVRNKMGYAKRGGAMKMKHGGSTCKGMGAAVRGGNFTRNG